MSDNSSKKTEVDNCNCHKLKKEAIKQIKEINYMELYNTLLLHLEEKHNKSNLETLDINLTMDLKDTHKKIYKLAIFDTLEEMKKLFSDMFIIFTDHYYKECWFDKLPEIYYYNHLLSKFINNADIIDTLEDAVLTLLRKRQHSKDIDLSFSYKLVKAKNYHSYKNNEEPILSFHIIIECIYGLIRKFYLETGEISKPMLDILVETVKILAHEDTENIIRQINNGRYDENKIPFTDWLSFSYEINEVDQIDEIYLDIESITKAIHEKARQSRYEEVYRFLIDRKVFRKVIKQISSNNEIMKLLNNVYIKTAKRVIAQHNNVDLEIITCNNSATSFPCYLLHFYKKETST